MTTKTKLDLQMVYFRISPNTYAKIKANAALKKRPVQDYIADILIKEIYK
jgi:hypothetical protein